MKTYGIGLVGACAAQSGAGVAGRCGAAGRSHRPRPGVHQWGAPGGPVLRRGVLRRLVLGAFLAVAGHLAASGHVVADDFGLLLQSAESAGTVSALVTGWRPVTGDEPALGSRGDGLVAITGDEFVKQLEGASSQVSVTRRYENFPVLAIEMDARALRAAKAQGSGIEIWDDPVLEPLLDDSVDLVGARQVWQRGYSGWGLAVAVIDNGVDTRHPFLAGRTVFEACFADVCPNGQTTMHGRGAARPVGTHGTHVAGIVLGHPIGDVIGVGPNLRLLAINVMNRERRGMNGRNILAGLDIVLTLARRYPGIIGAVNMSLGGARQSYGHCRSRIWDLAARELRRAGVAVVVASGNDSRSDRAAPVSFPACIEGFVSVGAVTKSRQVATFSNSGPALDLLAPGVRIRSSVIKEGERRFASMSGTSMAAPHVAAAMALMKQASPKSSVDELVRMLKSSGRAMRDPRSGIQTELIDIGRAIDRFGLAAASAEKESPVPQMSLGTAPAPAPDTAPDKGSKGWKAIAE